MKLAIALLISVAQAQNRSGQGNSTNGMNGTFAEIDFTNMNETYFNGSYDFNMSDPYYNYTYDYPMMSGSSGNMDSSADYNITANGDGWWS